MKILQIFFGINTANAVLMTDKINYCQLILHYIRPLLQSCGEYRYYPIFPETTELLHQ